MMLRTAVIILLVFYHSLSLSAQTTNPQNTNQSSLLQQTVKSGAFAETLTQFCTQKNAQGAQRYQAALTEWKQRNYWDAIAPKAAPGELEAAHANAVRALDKQGIRAAVLCLDTRKVLTSPNFDPSQQHAQELAQLAGQNNSAPSAPPSQQAQTTIQQQSASPNLVPQQPGSGGTVQVGDATFVVPATWSVAKTTATEALIQRFTKYHEMQLIAFEQRAMQGDLKSSFIATVRGIFPGTPPKLEYVNPAVTRNGFPAVFVRDGSQLRTKKSAAIRAVGIALPNSQIFIVMLISTDSYSALSDAEKDLTSAVSSLTFRSQGNAALWNPIAQPNSQDNSRGLYWYNTILPMPNGLGGMDVRAIRKYVVLLPGGHAYSALPEGGHVLDMDFVASCSKHPNHCGSYTIQGGTIRFRWPEDFGLTTEKSGAWAPGPGGSLVMDKEKYQYVAPVSNIRLNGRFRSFFASVGSTVTGSTSVSSEKFITFTPDGHYQKQGFSGASFTNDNAMGTFGSRKGIETGSYQIDGFTLKLTPQSTGSPEFYTLVLEHPAANPAAVFINDDAYLSK